MRLHFSGPLQRPERRQLSRVLGTRYQRLGTIVDKRSVSIAQLQIRPGCMTDMERRNAVTVGRQPRGYLLGAVVV